jgi:hypothetical protein
MKAIGYRGRIAIAMRRTINRHTIELNTYAFALDSVPMTPVIAIVM